MNWSKIIDYVLPVALVTVAFAMGFIFGEFKRINEHSDAEDWLYGR